MLRAWLCTLVWLALSLPAWAGEGHAVQVLQAQVQVTDNGSFEPQAALPALDPQRWQPATLPQVLPRALVAGERGSDIVTAWIRIAVPEAAQPVGAGSLRLYLPRWQTIGQIAVYADERLVFRSGAGPIWNGFNHPLWVALDDASGAHPRSVLLRVDHLRSAGAAVSTAWLGDEAGLGQRRWVRETLQAGVPYIASAAFLVIGFFALAVWAVRREAVYGLFFISSVLFFVRALHYHLGLEPLPISEAWFGWMTVHSVSWLVVTVHFFGFRLHGRRYPWVERPLVLLVLLGTLASLPPVSVLPQVSLLAPLAYLLMIIATIGLASLSIWSAWRSRSGDAMLVALWNAMSIPTSIHDWLLQNYKLDIENLYLLPYTAIGLFVAFMVVVLRRYVGALRHSERAQADLAARLAEREAELTESHAKLRAIEHEQILNAERQRLMQDMHDGLGSSLMGALKAVEHGHDQNLAEVLRACIDDLKLAIDSLEPVQADLLLLLATLRFRLGTRLEQAGVRLHWDVEDVPPLAWLDPRSALHILRILQEILGNAVKHSQARGGTSCTSQCRRTPACSSRVPRRKRRVASSSSRSACTGSRES
ncbi:MAG: histidine kinase, partial [Haliea sp.]